MTLTSRNHITVDQVLKLVSLVLFFTGILWYLLYQSQNLIRGPQIVLERDSGTIQHERIITLSGTTENITFLSLNGREIHTNEEGHFKESLVLENGYTIMTLGANDRYGRSVSLSRSFVYIPKTATN